MTLIDDKELLKLAAKAAGIDGFWDGKEQNKNNKPYWNPLVNLSNAFDLLTKLKLKIAMKEKQAKVYWEERTVFEFYNHEDGSFKQTSEVAAKRAIVRAAAAIGEGM